MKIKYDVEIKNATIEESLHRLINQTYKLLPDREEGSDWSKPLGTILEEFCGMSSLVGDQEGTYFKLLCKLEGLYSLSEEEQFQDYRRAIFDCINVINDLKNELKSTR